MTKREKIFLIIDIILLVILIGLLIPQAATGLFI